MRPQCARARTCNTALSETEYVADILSAQRRMQVFVKAMLKRLDVLLVGLCFVIFCNHQLALSQEQKSPPPAFVAYPTHATLTELQRLKLKRKPLSAPWTGYHYDRQTHRFLETTLPSGTEVWVDDEEKPIYMARCQNLLVPRPSVSRQPTVCPVCPPAPVCRPCTGRSWSWLDWLLLLALLLLALGIFYMYVRSHKKIHSLREQLDESSTRLAELVGQLDREKEVVRALEQQLVDCMKHRPGPVPPTDSSSYLLPTDGCIRLEKSLPSESTED
jgi:hypothetical protein